MKQKISTATKRKAHKVHKKTARKHVVHAHPAQSVHSSAHSQPADFNVAAAMKELNRFVNQGSETLMKKVKSWSNTWNPKYVAMSTQLRKRLSVAETNLKGRLRHVGLSR